MDAEYIEPTAHSRRRILLIFVIALLVGVVLIRLLEAHLERTRALPICDQIFTFRWLWAAVWIGLVGVGIWMAQIARRSLSLNQWPLPGTSVLRRTPIQRGRSVKRRAYVLLGWSLLVLVGSTWSWYAGDAYVSGVESKRCIEK
jgi:hypothetical protein